ncbi:hypothetical protein [Pseudodonghicola flavimaris]|uniref:Calcium-binding protein n=1 Tax=Pseudodonghicola flavimaris TaxID=3050036 RepID=A0ABT7EY37_9RHOB|nr:hypothetical protein [Pseudodonghicola flavimaris]MDK3017261.1 hypothetical protein [Pseudodonghicola flavimaris]
MNYAFRYSGTPDQPYAAGALAAGPFSTLVLSSYQYGADYFDLRFDGGAVLEVEDSTVEAAFGYLSLGRVQRAHPLFDAIGSDNMTATPTTEGGEAALDVFDIYYWREAVQTVLVHEIDGLETLGYTGVFLDDTARYFAPGSYQEQITADTGSAFDDSDALGNAASATLDAIIALAQSTDLDVWVNADAFMLSNHASGSALIADFAAEVAGVVIENYWANHLGVRDFDSAVATYANLGIEVYVSSDFDLSDAADPTAATSYARGRVNAYFKEASKNGYIPTASYYDSSTAAPGETPPISSSYDRFYPDLPIFNHASDAADVLAALEGPGDLDGLGGRDTLFGSDAADSLRGGTGADRLFGGKGADVLLGGAHGDSLRGGAGRDTLRGGGGEDILIGGKHPDTFVFSGAFGIDHVDFHGRDVLKFISGNGEAGSFEAFMAATRQDGADTVYDLGNDGRNVIILQNTQASDLQESDFLFL